MFYHNSRAQLYTVLFSIWEIRVLVSKMCILQRIMGQVTPIAIILANQLCQYQHKNINLKHEKFCFGNMTILKTIYSGITILVFMLFQMKKKIKFTKVNKQVAQQQLNFQINLFKNFSYQMQEVIEIIVKEELYQQLWFTHNQS
ncbi:unnamed protein product [Paramecium pentaurelia]|uniref:Transmembrane protein n=1 Tax=Paramecium pentaurelia TaxID=43138 RepID=A0A8S1Y7X1_9CILI|nr:unnamed protein product [Paramecium pentaurelia]